MIIDSLSENSALSIIIESRNNIDAQLMSSFPLLFCLPYGML